MYKVIIADDEPFIRAGLYGRIDWKSMGFEVVGVLEDGKDVLKSLDEERVDVLLTDICMNHVSGLQTAEIIKEKYPWMKVILFSGYQEFEYAREAMHYGVCEYLLKPINYKELRKVLANVKEELDRKRYEEQLISNLGEKEYAQILSLTRSMANSVLGDGEEMWHVFVYLKPIVLKGTLEIRRVVILQLLSFMMSKLEQKDQALAGEFANQIKGLDFSQDDDMGEGLSSILSRLNDELIARGLVPIPRKGKDDSIQKACNYINNHLEEDLSYEQVAEYVCMSPRHFSRRFRDEMGKTFTEYIVQLRVERAMKLLDEGKVLVDDIGATVGYRDDKYFQQIFKKYTGCTVREYQKRGHC